MRQPVFYAKIFEKALSVTSRVGIDEETAKLIAKQIAGEFCDEDAGNIYRIPNLQAIRKAKRVAQIKEDAKQMPVSDVALKNEVSLSYVYRTIKV